MKKTSIWGKFSYVFALVLVAVMGLSSVPNNAMAASSLFSDGFEDGNYSSWDSNDSHWVIDSSDSQEPGIHHALVTGSTDVEDDILLKSVDTSGYEDLTLSYLFMAANLEPGNHIYLEYSVNDGVTWVGLAEYNSLTAQVVWGERNFDLPLSASNNEDFQFRFRASDLNDVANLFRLDNVSLTGMLIPDADNSTVTVSDNYVPTQGGITTIGITVKDLSGNPVVGIDPSDIIISATGDGNTINQPNSATNAIGYTYGGIQSSVLGEKEVTVTVKGVTLGSKPTITFYTSPPVKANISANPLEAEASLQGSNIDLDIALTDSFNNAVPSGIVVNVTGLASSAGVLEVLGNSSTDINGQVERVVSFNNKGTVTMKVNTYNGDLTVSGDVVVYFIDTTKPEITLLGDNPAFVEFRTPYTDAGATGFDNMDGVIGAGCSFSGVHTDEVNQVSPFTDRIVGVYNVLCKTVDASQNMTTENRIVNVQDTVAPTIAAITSDATEAGWLKVGNVVNFTLTSDLEEPAGTTVAGTYNGVALTWSTTDNTVWTAPYTIAEGDTDQVLPLQITGVTMTDEAGNESAAADGSDVVKSIDANTPVKPSINLPDYVNIANKSAVTFTVTGEAATKLNYRISDTCDHSIQLLDIDFTGNYTSDLDLSGFCDGEIDAIATLKDIAGNLSAEEGDLSLKDTVAPLAPVVTLPTYVNTVNQASVTIGGTGEADADILFRIVDEATGEVTGSGVVDEFGVIAITGVDVSSLLDGELLLYMSLTDEAGNKGDEGIVLTVKETVKPTLLSLTYSAGSLMKAGTYELRAIFSEDTDGTGANIAIAYSDVSGTCDDLVTTSMVSEEDDIFTYSLVVSDDCDAAHAVVTISAATDLAGNTMDDDSTNTFDIDTLAPVFSATAPASGSFINNYSVSYTLSEELAGGGIKFSDNSVFVLSGDQLLAGTHTILEADLTAVVLVDGQVYSVEFAGTDLAGNDSAFLENTEITYDVTASKVLNVSSDNLDGAYKAGEVIAITVEMDEAVLVEGTPRLELALDGDNRFADFADVVNPEAANAEPLDDFVLRQITDTDGNESGIDVAILNGVRHLVYVRDGYVYYKNTSSDTEELISAGSDPSIAIGPNGVAQVVFVNIGSVRYAIREGGSWRREAVVLGSAPEIDVDGINHPHIVYRNTDSKPDVMYVVGDGSAFLSPVLIFDGFYWYDGGKTGRYYTNPVIKVDFAGNYHIAANHQTVDGGMDWNESYHYIAYKNSQGESSLSLAVNSSAALGKNAMTLDAAGNAHIVYGNGDLYVATPMPTWSETKIGAGNKASLTGNGDEMGTSFEQGGVKYIDLSSEAGYEMIDESGDNSSIVMSDYTYIYYLKNNEIFEASNQPEMTGSVGSTLLFNYTVQVGDTSADLGYSSASALELNGGSIKDKAGNDANLELAIPAEEHSLMFNKNIEIDTTAPSVTISSLETSPSNNSPILVNINFSEVVTDFVVDDIDLTNGTLANFIGTGANYSFDLSPIADGEVVVEVFGNVAVDMAGNANLAANVFELVYDTTSPEVTDIVFKEGSEVSDGIVKAGDIMTVEVFFSEEIDSNFPVRLALSGANILVPSAMTQTGQNKATFDYTVMAGNGNTDVEITDGQDMAGNVQPVFFEARFAVDNTAPAIDPHESMTMVANMTGGYASLMFENTASDNLDEAVEVSCTPESGSDFDLGETMVVCEAMDEAGNRAADMTFMVTVNPDVIVELEVVAASPVTIPGPSLVEVFGVDQYDNLCTNDSSTMVVVGADNGGSLGSSLLMLDAGTADTLLTKVEAGTVQISVSSGILIPDDTLVVFEQSDTTGPIVVTMNPGFGATGVSVSSPLFVVFNEAIRSESVSSDNIKLMKADEFDTGIVPVSLSLTEGDMRVNIVPDVALDYSSEYFFVVRNVEDKVGNAMTMEINSLNSGFETEEDTADHTAPTVVNSWPSYSSNVFVDVYPYVDFSEAMLTSTLQTSNVRLVNVDADEVVLASIVIKNGGTRAEIQPAVALDYSTTYKVVVENVADEAGNLMVNTYNGNAFITEAMPVAELLVDAVRGKNKKALVGGDFSNGWSWKFEVTVPEYEELFWMRFNDWTNGMGGMIPVAGNMRYWSAQSDYASSDASVLLGGTGYSSEAMTLQTDLDSEKVGRQIEVYVEMQLPEGIEGGSYSTSYQLKAESSDLPS